jgi:cell wall-associated NlpC family hydrolase
MPEHVPIPDYVDLLGLPFERGGRGPDSYDCYGILKEMYRRSGVELPDFQTPGDAQSMADVIADESRRWRKVPVGTIGACHTFRVEGVGSHVGFCVEPDRFLHAIEPIGVTTDRLSNPLLKPLAAYDYV